ncbi:hypothetical protein ACFPM1_15175 [Halorubrum rubrum]|uniref:Transcriptional regulator n=1 Tax=Halorubrum rubrum TaxID=1126240 RepID=A0ABD5R636_9EURY|nr:hypothetical protein [Halorubrum rubrum]
MTTERTARKRLGVLVDAGFVERITPSEGREAGYRRTPRSIVLERVEQLLDSTDAETLATRVAEMSEVVRRSKENAGEQCWPQNQSNLLSGAVSRGATVSDHC